MITIKQFGDGVFADHWSADFYREFISICDKHRSEGRAQLFAFLLYDFHHPHIVELLQSQNYWNGLDHMAGNTISIFALHSPADRHTQFTGNRLPPFGHTVRDILDKYFDCSSNCTMPAILFFQVEEGEISKSLLVTLAAGSIETSFQEISKVLNVVCDAVQSATDENERSPGEVFASVESALSKSRAFIIAKLCARSVIKAAELVSLLTGLA